MRTGGFLSRAPCRCVFEWERKKLPVTVWDKKSTHHFQACLNMYCTVQVLSPCQTVNHLCDTTDVPQPVSLLWLTDYVCQPCQVPDSHGASICTSNEVLHSRPAVWMTQSVIHAAVRAETVFPQTDPLHSFDCLGWISKQSDCLPQRLPPLFSRSPVPLWNHIKLESPRCGAGTAAIKQNAKSVKANRSPKINTRAAWTDLAAICNRFGLLVILRAAWEHSQPYLLSHINTVTTLNSVAIDYN